ncbi:MAG TPA: hypothetical protein VHX16_02825 [Chloroflexota bacterium]|jgi:hypothetical protein|nr:hypothetical protein [Chloroflexota bacterium]
MPYPLSVDEDAGELPGEYCPDCPLEVPALGDAVTPVGLASVGAVGTLVVVLEGADEGYVAGCIGKVADGVIRCELMPLP